MDDHSDQDEIDEETLLRIASLSDVTDDAECAGRSQRQSEFRCPVCDFEFSDVDQLCFHVDRHFTNNEGWYLTMHNFFTV